MTRLSHVALLGAATLGILSLAPRAQAFTFTQSAITDTEFNQLILDGNFAELFVAESRWGNNGPGGDRELGINSPLVPNATGTGLTGGDPLASGQRTWVTGEVVAFELSYNALTGDIAYTVGGQTLTANSLGDVDGIFLRTRALGRSADATTASLFQNLFLDGGSGFQALADFGSTSTGTNSDVDYLVVSGLNGSFTLKGEQIFDWSGSNTPTGSRLANQIKVGSGPYTRGNDSTPVPEPMTLLGALAAVGISLTFKQRGLG